jgi:hypothetical protein
MISFVIAVLAAAGASAAGPLPPPGSAVQARPAPSATAASPQPRNPEDKLVCRRMEETGSLLPGPRVCKTAWEWARIRQDSRDYVEGTQHNGDQRNPKGF